MKRRIATTVIVLAALLVTSGTASGRPAVSRSFFGIVPLGDFAGKDLQRLDAAKVRAVRWMFHWPAIQPNEGAPLDWTATDQFIGKMADRGIRVLPFFYASPTWAANDLRKPPLGSPEARQGWKEFVKEGVQRYGRNGTFWALHPELPYEPVTTVQVWNEQNSSAYFEPKASVTRYAKLLHLAAQGIRSADPTEKVLLGGMFGTPNSAGSIPSWKFLHRLYGVPGAKRDFDGVAIHPYSPNLEGTRFQIERLRRQMKAHGDGKVGTWLTELGAASGHGLSQLTLGRRGQARMLKQSFSMLLHRRNSWHIKQVYWFTWRDPGQEIPTCEFCRTAGLFFHNFEPKPSWRVFKRFTAG